MKWVRPLALALALFALLPGFASAQVSPWLALNLSALLGQEDKAARSVQSGGAATQPTPVNALQSLRDAQPDEWQIGLRLPLSGQTLVQPSPLTEAASTSSTLLACDLLLSCPYSASWHPYVVMGRLARSLFRAGNDDCPPAAQTKLPCDDPAAKPGPAAVVQWRLADPHHGSECTRHHGPRPFVVVPFEFEIVIGAGATPQGCCAKGNEPTSCGVVRACGALAERALTVYPAAGRAVGCIGLPLPCDIEVCQVAVVSTSATSAELACLCSKASVCACAKATTCPCTKANTCPCTNATACPCTKATICACVKAKACGCVEATCACKETAAKVTACACNRVKACGCVESVCCCKVEKKPAAASKCGCKDCACCSCKKTVDLREVMDLLRKHLATHSAVCPALRPMMVDVPVRPPLPALHMPPHWPGYPMVPQVPVGMSGCSVCPMPTLPSVTPGYSVALPPPPPPPVMVPTPCEVPFVPHLLYREGPVVVMPMPSCGTPPVATPALPRPPAVALPPAHAVRVTETRPVATTSAVKLQTPQFEAQCDRVSCNGNPCELVLEGNVRLKLTHVPACSVVANRIVINTSTGTFRAEGNTAPTMPGTTRYEVVAPPVSVYSAPMPPTMPGATRTGTTPSGTPMPPPGAYSGQASEYVPAWPTTTPSVPVHRRPK